MTTPDFTLAGLRLQAVNERFTILVALLPERMIQVASTGQAEPIVEFGQVPHQHCSQMRCGFLVGSPGDGVAVRELRWYTVEKGEGKRAWHNPRKIPW